MRRVLSVLLWVRRRHEARTICPPSVRGGMRRVLSAVFGREARYEARAIGRLWEG